jgi:hypothetical protein
VFRRSFIAEACREHSTRALLRTPCAAPLASGTLNITKLMKKAQTRRRCFIVTAMLRLIESLWAARLSCSSMGSFSGPWSVFLAVLTVLCQYRALSRGQLTHRSLEAENRGRTGPFRWRQYVTIATTLSRGRLSLIVVPVRQGTLMAVSATLCLPSRRRQPRRRSGHRNALPPIRSRARESPDQVGERGCHGWLGRSRRRAHRTVFKSACSAEARDAATDRCFPRSRCRGDRGHQMNDRRRLLAHPSVPGCHAGHRAWPCRMS